MNDKEKLISVINDVQNKSNKDLILSRDLLFDEYNKTKEIIIELTHHLDKVEESFSLINDEMIKRTKK